MGYMSKICSITVGVDGARKPCDWQMPRLWSVPMQEAIHEADPENNKSQCVTEHNLLGHSSRSKAILLVFLLEYIACWVTIVMIYAVKITHAASSHCAMHRSIRRITYLTGSQSPDCDVGKDKTYTKSRNIKQDPWASTSHPQDLSQMTRCVLWCPMTIIWAARRLYGMFEESCLDYWWRHRGFMKLDLLWTVGFESRSTRSNKPVRAYSSC